jgi:hypothetical protein
MFFCDPLRHRPACGESASDLARRVASDSSSVLSSLTCFLRRARHSLSDSSVFFKGFFLGFRFFSTMAAPGLRGGHCSTRFQSAAPSVSLPATMGVP